MARKIQPRSKVPKPKKGQSSEEYWRERESRQRAINIRDEARTAERINEIFESMQDSIQQEIESFYQRYADDEGITLTEARGRVSRIDMEQYERLAKKYVESAHHGDRDTAFSQEANDQMRLYNLTMKVNRLEMLKARCGIRAMEGYRDTERLINENLEERAYSEYRRLAGILGNSVQFNENMVRAIVNASYQNATWSQRLWNHQASLSSQIGTQLASGILAGKSSTVLAREIQKLTGGSTYACQRLMRTEFRRVQTEAALQSMTDNGVTEYKFIVANGVNPCEECLALDGQVFKLSDMNVGKNAPPIHPSCHCASAPHVDETKWQRWLDGPAQAGVPWAEFEGELPSFKGNYNKYSDPNRTYTLSERQKMAEEADNIVSQYTNRESKWSGKVVYDITHPYAKLPNCDISLAPDATLDIAIHEDLHSRSISHYPDEYGKYKPLEEASVQMMTELICREIGITPSASGYQDWIDQLKEINVKARLYESEDDFIREMYENDPAERYDWLYGKVHGKIDKTATWQEQKDIGLLLQEFEPINDF